MNAATTTPNGTATQPHPAAPLARIDTRSLAQPLLTFSPEQEEAIRTTFLNGASKSDAAWMMEVARLRGLNPLTRQIHFVKRYDGTRKMEVWSVQVSIDGLRSIAERTGKYDGQDEPEAVDHPQYGKGAKVRVYRKDIGRAFVGVAYWREFSQTKSGGELVHMWAKYPFHMLAKCAEALALRKAFPEDTGGLYTDDEMPSDDERAAKAQDVTPPPAEPARNRRSGNPQAQPPAVESPTTQAGHAAQPPAAQPVRVVTGTVEGAPVARSAADDDAERYAGIAEEPAAALPTAAAEVLAQIAAAKAAKEASSFDRQTLAGRALQNAVAALKGKVPVAAYDVVKAAYYDAKTTVTGKKAGV